MYNRRSAQQRRELCSKLLYPPAPSVAAATAPSRHPFVAGILLRQRPPSRQRLACIVSTGTQISDGRLETPACSFLEASFAGAVARTGVSIFSQ